MKNATILRLTSILLILTLMIGMIPAASASNEVYFPVYMGNSSSIVDALRSLDIDPSYQNRERIAERRCRSAFEKRWWRQLAGLE